MGGHLFRKITFYSSIAMFTCLCVVCGSFCATDTEVSSCNRDLMVVKA